MGILISQIELFANKFYSLSPAWRGRLAIRRLGGVVATSSTVHGHFVRHRDMPVAFTLVRYAWRCGQITRCLLSTASYSLPLATTVNEWQWPVTAANLQARNPILLRSYYMAPWQKSALLSAVVDKGRRILSNKDKSSQSLPGDPNGVANLLSSPSTPSPKKFKKSNDARRDISVLAVTYILHDSPTIRELIRLIISLNDHDDSSKVCTTCNPR